MTPLMKCGHAANATDNLTGKPCCAICVGLTPNADEAAEAQPDLTGRTARCSCKNTAPSSTSLPFFEYRGPGSKESFGVCKCGYSKSAHDSEEMKRTVRGKSVIEDGRCKIGRFEARGPAEFDSYFCGHSGWD